MNDSAQFSDWLKAELEIRGWDSLDLAVESFISEQSIKNYLQGRLPNLDYFLRIIKAFGKHIEIVDDGGSKWTIN